MMRKGKKRKEKKMENKYPAHGKLRKRLFGHFIKKSFKKNIGGKMRWMNLTILRSNYTFNFFFFF